MSRVDPHDPKGHKIRVEFSRATNLWMWSVSNVGPTLWAGGSEPTCEEAHTRAIRVLEEAQARAAR